MRRLLMTLCVLMLCSVRPAGFADDKSVAATIAQLIEQLSDADMTTRDAAVLQLQKSGAAAIQPTTNVALGDNLEASVRAVMVLDSLVLSDIEAVSEAADESLLRIKVEGKPALARRAQEALNRHSPIRQRRAIVAVEKFGGQIGTLNITQPFGFRAGRTNGPPHAIIDRHWQGGDAGFKYLGHIESLEVIYLLRGHPISKERLADFRREYPTLSFAERGPAYLGVSSGSHPLGCYLNTFADESPAKASGLQEGDIVVSIGGYQVQSPDNLISAVAEFQPDEVVTFVILRDTENSFLDWFQILRRNEFEDVPVLLPIALLHATRTEIPVRLGRWRVTRQVASEPKLPPKK